MFEPLFPGLTDPSVEFGLREGASAPIRATAGSVGYDLAALTDTVILPGRWGVVDTGVVLVSPVAAFLYARSSLFLRYGVILANGVGVIDPDYQGTIKVPLFNVRADTAVIAAGERIAQLVFHPVNLPVPEVFRLDSDMQNLHEGFGSTGV